MGSKSQKFQLVGPHAGRTMHINGHEFIEGDYVYHGSELQIGQLVQLFSFYGAYPDYGVADAEANYRAALAELEAAGLPVPAPHSPTPTNAIPPLVPPVGSTDATGSNNDDMKPTLAEAIGKLDPDNEGHWTSNNLPAIDALEALTGGKVSRKDVEAVAEDFTRAKAKALREG